MGFRGSEVQILSSRPEIPKLQEVGRHEPVSLFCLAGGLLSLRCQCPSPSGVHFLTITAVIPSSEGE